jgi:hypothetical protein
MVLCFCAMTTLYPLSVRAQQCTLGVAPHSSALRGSTAALQCSAVQHSTVRRSGTRRGLVLCGFSRTALVRVRSAATDAIRCDRIRSDQIGSDRIRSDTTALEECSLGSATAAADDDAGPGCAHVAYLPSHLVCTRQSGAAPSPSLGPRCTLSSRTTVSTCSSGRWTTVANRPTGTAWYSRVPAWWYLARGTRVVLASSRVRPSRTTRAYVQAIRMP